MARYRFCSFYFAADVFWKLLDFSFESAIFNLRCYESIARKSWSQSPRQTGDVVAGYLHTPLPPQHWSGRLGNQRRASSGIPAWMGELDLPPAFSIAESGMDRPSLLLLHGRYLGRFPCWLHDPLDRQPVRRGKVQHDGDELIK
jgi:hypothetical protein